MNGCGEAVGGVVKGMVVLLALACSCAYGDGETVSWDFTDPWVWTESNVSTNTTTTGYALTCDAEILGYTGDSASIAIPEAIAASTTVTNSDSTEVTWEYEATVRSVGYRAGYGYGGVTNMTIQSGVTNIGYRAFYNCSTLTAVTIPDSVQNIGSSAFYNCGALAAVTIPESVQGIGENAFYKCTSLASVTIPDSVVNISAYAFSGCSNIVEVSIGCGVTNIGTYAFTGCRNIRDVAVSQYVLSTQLSSVFPSAYGYITNVSYSTTITNIGDRAFLNCSSLVDVTMPDSVKSVGENAFLGCSALENLYLTDLGAYCAIAFAGTYSSPLSYAENLYLDGELVTALEIPDGVTSIGAYAFRKCASIESVSIPDSVTSVGSQAFNACENITRAKVPQSVMSLGLASVFYSAYGSLQYLCLGANVSELLESEFNDCKALTEIEVAEGNENFYVSSDDGCLYDISGTTLWFCPRDATTMTIPDSVTAIGNYAFQSCTNITSVTIPDSVESIGTYSFNGCSNVDGILIPSNVRTFEETAFDGCDVLRTSWYRSLAKLAVSDASSETSSSSNSAASSEVSLTVTNVVVHYVMQSVSSSAVTPSETTGIVAVIAEVTSGGPVAIPSTWAEQYEGFEEKFGSDFTAAVTKETGKCDGSGNAMRVWQDFVAGTDPTDVDDVFTASITFDADGSPVISYSPELSDDEAAKRTYKIYGKASLNDDWTLTDGDVSTYNFFKVTVEMK